METHPPTLEVSFGELPRGISGVTAGSGKTAFLGKIRKARPKIKGAFKPLSQGSITCPAHLSQSYTSSLQRRPPTQTQTHTPSSRQDRKREEAVSEKPGRKEAGQTDRS